MIEGAAELQAYLEDLLKQNAGESIFLESLRSLLEQLQLSIPGYLIVVTGTNGKGSVTKLLESIYLKAGFRVAASTSPHLSDFCERLTLNGKRVEPCWVLAAMQRLEPFSLQSKNYFVFIYLALMLCIQRFNPEVTILEVGIGGRLDVSNLFDSNAAILTSVSLDHENLLGSTREAIAYEKSHLARSGRPFICGEPDRPETVDAFISQVGAELISINNAFSYKANLISWDWFMGAYAYTNLPLPQIKLQNAATALAAITCLQSELPVSQGAVESALESFSVPGRFEILRNQLPCEVILDVAHNPAAMQWLAEQLAARPCSGKTVVLLGMCKQKDIRASLYALLDEVDSWAVVPLNNNRGCLPEEINQELATLGAAYCYTYFSVEDALGQLLFQLDVVDRLIICGSFYLVGAVRDSLLRYTQ
jgi:dihydrofolate synthase/folylpolyglutamate synthase